MVTVVEQIKIDNEIIRFKVTCSCGHTMPMVFADRTICSHCGKWVYRNKQIEFMYKMKEAMIKEAKNDIRGAKKNI